MLFSLRILFTAFAVTIMDLVAIRTRVACSRQRVLVGTPFGPLPPDFIAAGWIPRGSASKRCLFDGARTSRAGRMHRQRECATLFCTGYVNCGWPLSSVWGWRALWRIDHHVDALFRTTLRGWDRCIVTGSVHVRIKKKRIYRLFLKNHGLNFWLLRDYSVPTAKRGKSSFCFQLNGVRF